MKNKNYLLQKAGQELTTSLDMLKEMKASCKNILLRNSTKITKKFQEKSDNVMKVNFINKGLGNLR